MWREGVAERVRHPNRKGLVQADATRDGPGKTTRKGTRTLTEAQPAPDVHKTL